MSCFLMWLWLNIFRSILKLIHFIYSGYELLDLGWLLLKRKYKHFLDISVSDSKTFVSNFVKKLGKCPSHIVVVVGEDGINPKEFSNLVIWCLAAKISFISFYDYSGYLKNNKHLYYQYLIEKRKIDPNCVIFDLGKQNNQNGILSKIHLNILSLQDGKSLFVEVTKGLGGLVISNSLRVTQINEKLITCELNELMGLPEPDLGVICGKTLGTLGLLPWHIKVTEFLQMKYVKGMKAWEFTSVLKAYSSCTQRFGK